VLFRLLLEYDGSGFSGWQSQAGATRTVQEVLEAAFEQLDAGPARVTGSGRTDAGVHAEGQVAGVSLSRDFEPEALKRALNAILPADLAVLGVDRASADFDARRDATGKTYRYGVWNGRASSPLRSARWHHVAIPLDIVVMKQAAVELLGTHDFACFQAAGSDVVDTVRDLRRLEVAGRTGAEIVFLIEGSGFLWHMVRTLAGTLLEVGRGRRDPNSMGALLASRDRRQAGPTAPAKGLTLVSVEYGAGAAKGALASGVS